MTERHEPEHTPKGRDEDGGAAAMDRFRDLTRGLLKVTPNQLRDERERHEQEAALKRSGPKGS